MRNRKRWAAVLLACSLAFSAVGDTRLIVHANEMWEEAGQEEYSVEVEKKSVKSKNKLDDLKENVEGAKKIGMQGLVYHGNVQELKQLIK